MAVNVWQNILARGDALAPTCDDLIVQVARLDAGEPLPEGWTVTSGNMETSEIVRVITRGDIEKG